jgi:hypothetical protein
MTRHHPPEQRKAPPQAAATRYRGPFPMTNGTTLCACPVHPWAAPSVVVAPGAPPVCYEGGHVLSEGEARRLPR